MPKIVNPLNPDELFETLTKPPEVPDVLETAGQAAQNATQQAQKQVSTQADQTTRDFVAQLYGIKTEPPPVEPAKPDIEPAMPSGVPFQRPLEAMQIPQDSPEEISVLSSTQDPVERAKLQQELLKKRAEKSRHARYHMEHYYKPVFEADLRNQEEQERQRKMQEEEEEKRKKEEEEKRMAPLPQTGSKPRPGSISVERAKTQTEANRGTTG